MFLNIGIMIVIIFTDISYFKPIKDLNKLLGINIFMAEGFRDTWWEWFMEVGVSII